MSARDYEDQPQAPDLGQEVQQDTEQTLVGPPGADPLDAGYLPPDRPYLVDRDQAVHPGESLERRLDRERPDVGPDAPHAVADRAPRLAPGETGADGTETEALEAVDAGLAGGAASAEAAAVHADPVDQTGEELGDLGRLDAVGEESDADPAEAKREARRDAEVDAAIEERMATDREDEYRRG